MHIGTDTRSHGLNHGKSQHAPDITPMKKRNTYAEDRQLLRLLISSSVAVYMKMYVRARLLHLSIFLRRKILTSKVIQGIIVQRRADK